MRLSPVHLGRGLGVLLGVAASTMASAQPSTPKAPPASVHKIVVYQGPNRSVHYITTGNLSTSDRRDLSDLQRAENELAYTHDLQSLKQQYVNNERAMEARRHIVQLQLYGRRISSTNYNAVYGGYGGSGWGNGGWGYGGWGGWGYGPYASPYGYAGYSSNGGLYGFVNSNLNSEVRSLQYGMGDEGRMKNALVAVISHEATAEHAAATLQGYDAAVGRAANSTVLSRDLGLKKDGAAPKPAPSPRKGAKVTIWTGDTKHVGTVKDVRPDAVVLQTDKGEVTVNKSAITRWEEAGNTKK